MSIFFIYLTAVFCSLIHLGSIVVVARLLKVGLRQFAFGTGPIIWSTPRIKLAFFMFGGSIRFVSVDDFQLEEHEKGVALENKPILTQLCIALSGCFVLVMLAYAILGNDAHRAFLVTPMQVFNGAISPLDEGQTLLKLALVELPKQDWPVILGVVAIKLAALNLMPFPVLNGGAAIRLLACKFGLLQFWPSSLTIFLMVCAIPLMVSWLFAFLVFVWPQFISI